MPIWWERPWCPIMYSTHFNPITNEMIYDPVAVTVTGHFHERNTEQHFVESVKMEPIAHQKCSINDLIPNENVG